MALTPKFSKTDVSKMFLIRLQRIEKVIINRLILIGERFVKNARENGNYLDQTGNLRSSIGYLVLKNGNTVIKNFQQASKGSDKSTGVKSGKDLAEEISNQFLQGYVLIVVAGMNYAASVESKGKDVLTASAIAAKNELVKAISDIKRKVNTL